jgi:hypothetical protein
MAHALHHLRPGASARICRLLSVMAGIVLIVATAAVEFIIDQGLPRFVIGALIVSGCVFLALGMSLHEQRILTRVARVSLSVLSAIFLLAIAEAAARFAQIDFERLDNAKEAIPPYYVPPTLHAGEGVFRRPGPSTWRGSPLTAYLHARGMSGDFYAGEQQIVVDYDALGFRNPPELSDWEVAVAGDSFVELGHLPYEQLFTTIAARKLGIRIKNLGVSCTGPISQTYYLENYGKSASTHAAVICFFEGNDLNDLEREQRNAASVRATGEPLDYRRQSSLARAIWYRVHKRTTRTSPIPLMTNAVLITETQFRPMTVGVVPPTWDGLSQRKKESLVSAIANWAATARSHQMEPWLMYLPDSRRVFHGHIGFADTNSALALWKPGEFAQSLETVCLQAGVRFINPLPALQHAVETGKTPYNLVGDTHLNAEGSLVVANVLAEALECRK